MSDQEYDSWIPLRSEEGQNSKPSSRSKSIEERLETKVTLKSNLVDHPIDLFWKRYLLNLAQEVWGLEWYLRLGLLLIVAGILLRSFLLTTWYLWYPRIAVGTLVILTGTIFLDPFDLKRQFAVLAEMIGNPEKFLDMMHKLSSTGIKRLVGVVMLFPTALEIRTLSFLSGIKAETGWTLYNVVLSGVLLCAMMYWFKVHNIKPRECLYRGLILLYASALGITIYRTDLSRLPVIAAPFLTATGTLLITYQDDDMEWVSRVLRHALRLTLRDVLSSMSNRVSQDEMLQLAILRWIADYWASSSTGATDNTTEPQGSGVGPTIAVQHSANMPPSDRGTANTSDQNGPSTQQQSRPPANTAISTASYSTRSEQRMSTSSILQRRDDVSWDDLLPMLNVATELMTSELQLLQSSTSQAEDTSSNTTWSASTKPSPSPSTEPIDSFHDMLACWNVDVRAAPAVRAYKNAVLAFPPTQGTAVLLSTLRRCPAAITILFHLLTFNSNFLLSTLVLLPFVCLEYYRILDWLRCCEEVKVLFDRENGQTADCWWIPDVLKDANSMIILLAGDSCHPTRQPTLLLVWQNILNSVSALEVGLTAAKCAQTTAVAVQFAGNMISLVRFGQEVHEHGLLHGLLVLGKEAVLFYTMDKSMRHREATKYTSAAMDAVQNAQRVARNLQNLAHDDYIGHFIQPVMWAVTAWSRFTLLWGGEETRQEDGSEQVASSESSGDLPVQPSNEKPTISPTPNDAGKGPNTIPVEVDRISDLMDEIASAYGEKKITPTQKDDLFERLSRASGSDEAGLQEIEVALTNFVSSNDSTAIESRPRESTQTPKERISPSAVMEMVLAAYYRGLIDQTEKASFCEKIAALSDEERTDPDMVGGMMRALNALLENGRVIDRQEAGTGSILSDTLTPLTVRSDAAPQQTNPPRHNDAWLRLGMATLGVVVGGLVSSQNTANHESRGRGGRHNRSSSDDTGEAFRNAGSTVQIEEIEESAEEEWITVPQ